VVYFRTLLSSASSSRKFCLTVVVPFPSSNITIKKCPSESQIPGKNTAHKVIRVSQHPVALYRSDCGATIIVPSMCNVE
jgi:hypothetical protein